MVFVNSLTVRFQTINRLIHFQHSRIASILIGPAVKFLLLRYNLDLGNIKKRSGPKSNIIKSDVLNYIFDANLSPISLKPNKYSMQKTSEKNIVKLKQSQNINSSKQRQQFFEIPITASQKEISERLSYYKVNIPHCYASISISTLKIKQLCHQLKLTSSVDLSIETFIIYACANALKSIPEINVHWNGDHLQKASNIHISLYSQKKNTIIFNNADQISVETISELLNKNKDLENKQNLNNTFSISNLSMFNSVSKFTSIINFPQTSILTIGKENNKLNITLCYDARAIQQEDAHKFLNILAKNLAEPTFNLFLTSTTALFDDLENDKNKSEKCINNTGN